MDTSLSYPATGGRPAPRSSATRLADGLHPGLAYAAAFLVIATGIAVLAGWALNIPALKSVVPGLRVMVANTALAFVLTGIALAVAQGTDVPRWRARATAVLISVVLAFAGLTLVEYLTGLRLGVEKWIVAPDDDGPYAGRMSQQTAINFVLISAAILLVGSKRRYSGFVADTCALAVLLISWLALANYSYDITRLHNVARYPGFALHTAVGFAVLAIGLLFARRNVLVGRLMTGGAAGTLFRRFLPAALLVPLALGWVRIAGERAGWYDDPFGLALLSLAFTTVLIVLVWASAGAVARMDFKRRHAERALLAAYDNLEEQVARRTEELAKANETLRYEIGRRQNVEASLRVSERWFQDLFDRAPDPMCSFDALSGEILECNQTLADALGYSKHEVLGRPVLDLCEPDSVPAAASVLASFMRREPIRDEDLKLRRRDGTALDVSLSMSAVTSEAGEIVRARSIWRDITARKRAQQEQADLLAREQAARRQAEEADRLKDEFLASVSHELRAPLNPILGWVHVLRQGGVSGAVFDRALTAIERSARVQKQLVEDLLDASRITSGKLKLVMARVEMASIVDAAVDATRPTAAAKGISIITTHDPADAGAVLGDPDRLQQVVWNLVGNAIKFTPGGGEVRVFVRQTASRVEIVVSDTGPGIAPEFIPYLFDRFRQADGSTTRRHGGLGLGLSIVRHLVELHGGDVRVQKPREGRGATFVVSLPALPSWIDEQENPAQREPELRRAVNGDHVAVSAYVLVVDDDADARDLLVALLTRHGARAEAVARASDAFARLFEQTVRTPPFDAVVCDVGMPDEDGYTFIRRVRAASDPVVSLIPAIALTGYARQDDRARAIEAGFQVHLTKPVEATELVHALSAVTHRAPARNSSSPPA